MLSERLLDCKRYHGANVNITWRDCDLRKWLNGEFYNAAFNAAEMESIATTLSRATAKAVRTPRTKSFTALRRYVIWPKHTARTCAVPLVRTSPNENRMGAACMYMTSRTKPTIFTGRAK